jgi:hypothetical protein
MAGFGFLHRAYYSIKKTAGSREPAENWSKKK